MPKFILIGHKSRQGKDTFAEFLSEYLENSKITRFADPMKEILASTFGINEETLENLKNNPEIKIQDTSNTIPNLSFRDIIINFGNKKIKEIFGEFVWANLLYKRYEKSSYDYIIVPDFRFPIEYKEHAITVKVQRKQVIPDNEADIALNNFNFDYYIDNNGDLNSLKEKAEKFSKKLLTKF